MMLEDEASWGDWLIRFREYRDRWYDRGFMAMFRQVLDESDGIVRFMAFPDGERRVTNLLHLSEILHREEAASRCAPQLVKWLAGKRDSDTSEREEDLMRLESDDEAVRIVTIHKSKDFSIPLFSVPSSGKAAGKRRKARLFSSMIVKGGFGPFATLGPRPGRNTATWRKRRNWRSFSVFSTWP